MENIRDFVLLHYLTGKKNSKFWKEFENGKKIKNGNMKKINMLSFLMKTIFYNYFKRIKFS